MQWDDNRGLYLNKDGLIVGEVFARINDRGIELFHALVNGKFIGKYLNKDAAKNAVESNFHLIPEDHRG